ncbi:MAG: cytochrome c biogenesis protein CcsA [Actinobacteria bacterium]|nr:cytochrome c biogenesis protein CcsA [Actinomycetota bacterium]
MKETATTRTWLTPVLGVLALGSLAVLAVLGLWVAPPDAVQGDAQRLMYVHVPTATLAYVAFGVTSLASALYLWRRTRAPRWDRLAASSAELGVVFTGLTLVLGMLWGRPVWGVYWTWDARLVSTAVLFFLYLGYLALRRVIVDPDARARRCAVAALVAFADIPIVHYSVEWWRSLHQDSTLLPGGRLDPEISGDMLVALLWGMVAFALTYAYLLVRRCRLAAMEEGLEQRVLDVAVAERRAEAAPVAAPVATPVPAPVTGGGRA